MKTIRAIPSLRRQLAKWRSAGERIAFVPTMGNLHRGHTSLVRLAGRRAERVVTSIFVNPSQFGPTEDFASYPRTLSEDRACLREVGADLLFLPGQDAIYPFGLANMTRVTVPGLTDVLCGAARPGHFDGVTSVVCRLLNIVQPDVVVFGQKDYQQLLVVRRMVADLHLPVKIVAGPTQREPDGLALSSRNQYLGADERAAAPVIFAALKRCGDQLRAGNRRYKDLERAGRALIVRRGLQPEYFAIRAAGDLAPPRADESLLVVLAAARCGRARLIDNLIVEI